MDAERRVARRGTLRPPARSGLDGEYRERVLRRLPVLARNLAAHGRCPSPRARPSGCPRISLHGVRPRAALSRLAPLAEGRPHVAELGRRGRALLGL